MWRSIRSSPVGVRETDEDLVLPPSLDQQVVSRIAFDNEAKTAQQAATPFVRRQVRRLHPVQPDVIKCVAEDADEGLPHETLTLSIFRERVPQITVVRSPAHDGIETYLTDNRRHLARVEQKELDRPSSSEIILVSLHLAEPERFREEIRWQRRRSWSEVVDVLMVIAKQCQ